MNKDYGKKNADLKNVGLSNAEDVVPFLIDNKYILFHRGSAYKVYNMMKDEWMLTQEKMTTVSDMNNQILNRITFWNNSRSVIINDQFLILSIRHNLTIFPIWNEYRITHLSAIHVYGLKTGTHYMNHGFCCIDFDYSYSYSYNDGDDDDDQVGITKLMYHNLSFKLLLFGGSLSMNSKYFCESFLTLDISLDFCSNINYKSCHDDNDGLQSFELDTNENEIEIKVKSNSLIAKDSIAQDYFEKKFWSRFAYGCILNGKNEPIVVIIGADQEPQFVYTIPAHIRLIYMQKFCACVFCNCELNRFIMKFFVATCFVGCLYVDTVCSTRF